MEHCNRDFSAQRHEAAETLPLDQDRQAPLVLVVEDEARLSASIVHFCEFLGMRVCRVTGTDHLAEMMRKTRPVAVLSLTEPGGLDSFVLLKLVAGHDRALPVLMITGQEEESVFRSFDQVEQSWGLSAVLKMRDMPRAGVLVDFLCRAGLRSGTGRLMPVQGAVA